MKLLNRIKKVFTEPVEEEEESNHSYLPKLSKSDKEEIAALVVKEADEYETSRTEYMERVVEGIRLYNGIREEKNSPWPNCANYSTMHTTSVVDVLHSRLFPMAWNTNSVGWRAKNKYSVNNLENVKRFMNALRENEMIYNSKYGMDDFVDDLIHFILVDGTVCIKGYWNTTIKNVLRSVQVDIEPGEDGLAEPKYETRVVKEEYGHGKVEFIPLEDCLFPFDAEDEQECRSVIHRSYYTLDELKELDGIENIDDLKFATEASILTQNGTKKEKLDNAGLVDLTITTNSQPIEVCERYGKYEYDGEMIECVFLVARKSKIFLRGYKLTDVSPTETRPFIIRPFLKRGTGLLGLSIPMLISQLQKLINAIHNQRIDMGNIAIAPPVFYRPGSGYDPEAAEWGPLLAVPIDEPSKDVYIPAIPTNGLQYSFQEESVVLSLIERLTSVGAYQLGLESEIVKSRATASGTIALIEQGQQKFNMLAKRIARVIADVLTRLKMLYEENISQDDARRMIGKDGELLFPDGLDPRDIIGQHEAVITINENAANKTFQNQAAMARFNLFSQDPFVNMDPRRMWKLRYDAALALGTDKPEDIIGPEPKGLPSTNYDADEEFDAMLAGRFVKPSEYENAMEHLMAHLAQMETDSYKNMPPKYKENFSKHLQITYQLVWKQVQQQYAANAQRQGERYGQGSGTPEEGSSEGAENAPGLQGYPGAAGGAQETGGGQAPVSGQEQGGRAL